MNPPFSYAVLVPLAGLMIGLAAYGSWRGTQGLPARTRGGLLVLRLAAVAAVLVLLGNPGKWVRPSDEHTRPWLVLADVSSSMNHAIRPGTTRIDAANQAVAITARAAKPHAVPVRVHPFAQSLAAAAGDSKLPVADGKESRIVAAVDQALQDCAAAGESPAGVIVISDGRQTTTSTTAQLDALALRARSRNIPVHTLLTGDDGPPPDLVLIQPRAAVTAFAGQPLHLPFALKSNALDPVRPRVALTDAAGKELAAVEVDVPAGKTITAAIDLKAPASSTQWRLETPVLAGEARASNNQATLNVRIVESKTRVFLVEGAPYWDSKFLAQLLRQQPQMDVHSVHRLSDERYFRIDSGASNNTETRHPVFPADLAELSRYDLIVFGKHIDPFLTPERAEALRAFVRDRGGAVLFARGKPASTELPALETLEPVVWGATSTNDFRFLPNRDGEAAGLFGQALPAPDASLWGALPDLKDGRQIATVKPFARVLADGAPVAAASTASNKFPVLVARRYGLGVTALVNGDGLWKWDFFPEARELGNCYEDFWIQLIQWLAAYSEFLPGQEFSLRLPSARGEIDQSVTLQMSYRGAAPAPQPNVEVLAPDGGASRLQPAAFTDASGRPAWRASFTPNRPGTWQFKVEDPRAQGPATPTALLEVPAPPREDDDLSADPALLATLAKLTGGQTLTPESFESFAADHLKRQPPVARESGAVWQPGWNHAWTALAIAGLFAGEWFLRRRHGLG